MKIFLDVVYIFLYNALKGGIMASLKKSYLVSLDQDVTEKLKVKLAKHNQKFSTFLNMVIHENLGGLDLVGVPEEEIKMSFSDIKRALKNERRRMASGIADIENK